jgi:glycerol-3-phosphate acyltransferase PlsY
MPYLLVAFAYLCGAIPFGLLFGSLKGIDVRKGGSGNIGATNVSRQLGKCMGLLTLVADTVKAILPMMLADRLLIGYPGQAAWVTICGAVAVLGHLFPVYLKFKGGKGVATAFGMLLFINAGSALSLLVVFILAVALSGFVSVGSLIASAMMPLSLWLFGAERLQLMVAAIVALLIWEKHWQNIVRLFRGEEKSWKKTAEEKKMVGKDHEERKMERT